MKKRNKWLIGSSTILAAYLLYPSSEPKIDNPIKIENKVKKKNKLNLKKINEVVNQNKPEEINLEEVIEESNLPPCLQCEDWKPKVKKGFYNNGQLNSIKTTNCGKLYGKQLEYYNKGQLEMSTNYLMGFLKVSKFKIKKEIL